MLDKYYDMISGVEMPEWSRDYNEIHKKRFAHMLSMLPDLTGKDVLEVGSYGLICSILRNKFSPKSVDITFHSPQGPDLIEQRVFDWAGDVPFKSYNIDLQRNNIPCDDGYYDYILCAEVIEHMPTDPMHLLCALARVCKPGGTLMLTTPNISSASAVARILQNKNPIGYCKFKKDGSSDRHNIEYTPGQVRGMVEAAGFEVVTLTTVNVWDMRDYQRMEEELSAMHSLEYDRSLRGDNIFCIAVRKAAAEQVRYPAEIYD